MYNLDHSICLFLKNIILLDFGVEAPIMWVTSESGVNTRLYPAFIAF